MKKIGPFLPVASEEGYRPHFKLYPAREWEEESFWKVTDLYFEKINEQLRQAKNGKKLKARQANQLLYQLTNEHGYDGPEIPMLMDSTCILGTAFFYLNMYAEPHVWNKEAVLDWLCSHRYFFKKSPWKIIHTLPEKEIKYDFSVELKINEVYVSPDNFSNSSRCYEKEIEVGKREIKDTSGNVTYEPIFEKVRATITTYELNKKASINAELTVYDLVNGIVVLRKNICGVDRFCDSYCAVRGDERAVDKSCSCIIPSFPSGQYMLKNSADNLARQILGKVKKIDVLE